MTQPEWFTEAVSVPRVARTVNVEDCEIYYECWPVIESKPGLVFVHGNGAHSHWWDFIAPAFTQDFNVMAMDMSGAGNSGHREEYSALTFANEIIEVCRDSGHGKCYVVGHSFGGSMTRIAGYLHGAELAGLVLVDSGIAAHRGLREAPARPRAGMRYYKTREEGMKRFRLRPPQPCRNDYIIDYIAAHSLKETESGFAFKLDQALFAKMKTDPGAPLPDAVSMIREISCPVGFVYGDKSRFFPPAAVDLLKDIIRPSLLRVVRDAHHHLFLDQPLAFADALADILREMR